MSSTQQTRSSQRILVVDDDKDLVRSVQAYLAARGYSVETAANGTEARAAIARTTPDLVILDVMMDTDAEGFAVAYALREDEATRRIPVILLTGFLKHLDEKYAAFEHIQGQDWPGAELMEKPVDLKKLGAAVAQHLAYAESLKASLAPAVD